MNSLARPELGATAALALSFVLAAGILMAPRVQAQAAAQDNTADIGEIVVTATRREAPLIDVPVAVSVLGSLDISERGFTEYGNYLNSLPGVYFADGGPSRSVVRIRSLSAAEGGLPTLVGTYFGETPTSVDGNYPNLRLVDIERVEVLRGPQGTLFGANSLAGAVRILPAQPNLQNYEVNLGTRGFTTAHSDDESYHVEGTVNLPLAQDRFALRLVGYKDDIAGYIDNSFPGQPALDYSAALGLPPGFLVVPAIAAFESIDINREDTVGGRAAALWQPTERLQLELAYLTQEVTLESEPHVTPSVGEYEVSRGMDVYSRGLGEEDTDIASLTLRYDWDAVSFTSNSASATYAGRTHSDITEFFPPAFGAPIPGEIRNTLETDAITQELRLQSRGSGAFQWLFGLFYLDRDRAVNQTVPDYSCPMCLPVLLGEQLLLRGDITFGEEQVAAFGELTYDFSPRWTASVGARYLEQDLALRIFNIDGLLGASLLDTDATGSIEEFNPSAHLSFQPSDDLTVYAQAARGFRSGSPNQALPSSCDAEAQARGIQLITDPDTLWNYELGLKSRFADDRVSINVAVYDADWEDIQLGAGLACGFNALINGGQATARGVEFELAAQPSDSWTFNLAASYNETTFEEVEPGAGFIEGERVPGSPRSSASAGVQYDFELGGSWSGFARVDYVYVGSIHLTFGPVLRGTQDAYGTGNLRLAFARDQLALELYGRNVADKRAVTTTGSPQFGNDQNLIRPRELGVELRYGFQ